MCRHLKGLELRFLFLPRVPDDGGVMCGSDALVNSYADLDVTTLWVPNALVDGARYFVW